MRVRSITCFIDPDPANYSADIEKLGKFSEELQKQFTKAGVEVQTRRLATAPFPIYTGSMTFAEKQDWMRRFEAAANQAGFTYVSFGPALPEYPDSTAQIPEFLTHSPNAFFAAVIADRFQIYPEVVRSAARVVVQAANIEPNGFANLQFAALANVPAGTPFFPASYHQFGQGLEFALAMECAGEVLRAFQGQLSLRSARASLLETLETVAARLAAIAESSGKAAGVGFKGFDFSPAPFPEDTCSLGGALEAVGQNNVGSGGSLAAAAVIADTLDQGKWQRAGFNGLMLPVLEDSILARRAGEGSFSVKDLLMYAAVCGTGLDTVPIPGNSSEEEIAAVLFDVAALAVRLGKPLTARLMPIPGKAAGERTNFDFDFFAPSRVLPLAGGMVRLPLNGGETVALTPRGIHQRIRQGRSG